MSVQVNELSKQYGEQMAVNQISFEAQKGEVLGFLGPNGAGKTTTMKIITCFMPPTSGKVKVCGLDTETNGIEVRRKIGYLPENNPLYLDMYVMEYLGFVAGLYDLQQKKSKVDEMIERTGLTLEQNKPIGALSKGYRQRVGLAQAMLHDPEVLILDEPTSGLDPNQLVEIRELIKNIGREKTVIFSTHIMQEVQALCDRVIIINRGKIVADDTIEHLKGQTKQDISLVTVAFNKSIKAEALQKISGVQKVTTAGKNRWQITVDTAKDVRPDLFHFAVNNGLILLELHKEDSTVEDVFQQLTKNN